MAMTEAERLEDQLIEDIVGFEEDPYGFVTYAFPWGEEDSVLQDEKPRAWQVELLISVSERIREGMDREDAMVEVIRTAVASGHGIGKSALVSWLIIWAMATAPDTRGVVTANTDTQLRTKTWSEVSKWHNLSICKHWFQWHARSYQSTDPQHAETWRIDAVPWSERNPEAFAGLHNKGRRLLLVFDEASAIPDSIWEVAEGAMTDEGTQIFWFVFGNPTRNTGRFRECFGGHKKYWRGWQIDARNVAGTNRAEQEKWIELYGEDSDFVRVRVRGEFPRASVVQFIGGDLVAEARRRFYRQHEYEGSAKVMGVDVGRQGDDECTIYVRQGLQILEHKAFMCADLMALATKVADMYAQHEPDAVFVDEVGIGAGCVDRLKQLHVPVIGVQFAGKANDSRFANKRMEMWWQMREALMGGLAIPDDPELEMQMIAPEYTHDRYDRLILERKEDCKQRCGCSPDRADGIALTYAQKVLPNSHRNLAARMQKMRGGSRIYAGGRRKAGARR